MEFKLDKSKIILGVVFITIVIVFIFIPKGICFIYQHFELSIKYSDILPTIEVMCERMLQQENIYSNIEKFGYFMPPTYLPFIWLPYTIMEFFGFDYRWMTLCIWSFSVLLFITFFSTKNKSFAFLNLGLFSILLLLFILKDASVLGWTIEFALAGYYLIFILSLFSNNVYFKAFGIVLCLLSRYSFIVFLPLYTIVLLDNISFKKNIITLALTILFLTLVLYPLVQNNWMVLYNGFKYYNISGLGEWQHLGKNGLPIHLFNGNGFSSFIYSFAKGSVEEKFRLAQSIHLTAVISTSICLVILYFITRKKIDHRIFLLCALKIYFAVFYGFLQVPYNYLFVVPLIVSIAIIGITHSFLNANNPKYAIS